MKTLHDEKRLLTVQELSKYLGLSPYTIRDKVRKGDFPFPAKRIGRLMVFDINEVDNYIDGLPIVGT